MATIARFPLSLVRSVIGMSNALDHRLADRFGFKRAKDMTPACYYRDLTKGESDTTHIGKGTVSGYSWMAYNNRYPVSRSCYIGAAGDLRFPG